MTELQNAIDIVAQALSYIGCKECPCRDKCKVGTKCEDTISNLVKELAEEDKHLQAYEDYKGKLRWEKHKN